MNDLKSELSGNLEDCLLALLEPSSLYDAKCLRRAMRVRQHLQYVIHVLIFYPFVCTIQSVLMFWPLFSLLFFRVLEQMRRHWLTFFVPVLTRFVVTCIIKCTGLSLKLKEAGLLRKVATIKVWMWSKNNVMQMFRCNFQKTINTI